MSSRAEATIRSYADAFDRADIDDLVAHYAPKTTYIQPFSPQPMTTPDEIRAFEGAMFAGFSDVHVEVEWLIADGDAVAAGVRVSAVHTADMPLPDGSSIPATGRSIVLKTAEHMRVDTDGRIVEHERYMDGAGFMAQLTSP